MDRIIEVKVGGNYLSKDNKNAGVRGEANVTALRITFDESWKDYAKKITFWDARGLNPRVVFLEGSLLEDYKKSNLVYLIPIPAEPLREAGTMTFVIDGLVDDKRMRSVSDVLEVKDAPIDDEALRPEEPTPTEVEQMQAQLEELTNTIGEAMEAKELTEAAKEQAVKCANIAVENATVAQESALIAQESVGRTSYIGENGNWFAWDSSLGEFYDTGIKAQAGSTVYVGDNPPEDADVWINPEGEGTKVKADWNQSNENAPDYIKNRTHYWAKDLCHTTPIHYADDTILYDEYTLVVVGGGRVDSSDFEFIEGKKYVIENEYAYFEFVYAPSFDGEYERFEINNTLENGDETTLYTHREIGLTSTQINMEYRTKKPNPTYIREGRFKIYRLEIMPLGKEFLPSDVEFTGNKKTTVDDIVDFCSDETYPSTKAVRDFVIGEFTTFDSKIADVVTTKVEEQTATIKSDVEGLQKQINEEAHFRGYLSTNAKIQALEATPNDFAYSAESNTKWVYDEVDGWKDTGVAVPDQLTPASNSTPLMAGAAEVGSEEAYARGDHRHPSDATKEDKTNKTSTVDANSTDEQYPSAKAVYEYDHDKWELVENVTLEQDVQRVYCDLKGGKYKELYIRFVIPTMNPDKASDFQKGRSYVYVNGVSVYDDGSYLYSDVKGTPWMMSHYVRMRGNVCIVDRYCFDRYYADKESNYLVGTTAAYWGNAYGMHITDNYMSELSIMMYPQGTRLFPAGTTYELWGVRA